MAPLTRSQHFLMFLFFGKLMVDHQISMCDELCSMSYANNECC